MLPRCILFSLIATVALSPVPARATECDARAGARSAGATARWSHWGVDVRNTRFQNAGAGGLAASEVPRLALKWAYSLGESVNSRSQPAVAGGKLFVGSEAGRVFALDVESGCTWWTFKADVSVRSGIVAAVGTTGEAVAVYFGDVAGSVYGVDATTGQRLWRTRVDPHFTAVVTGTPQLHQGTLYVPVSSYESVLPLQPAYSCCSFRGSLVAVDAASGRILWRTYTIADSARKTGTTRSGVVTRGPSGAAVWSTPTIDEQLDRIYFGTGNNYSDPATDRSDAVVALDRQSGRIIWSRQFTAGDAYNASCDVPNKPSCPAADGPDFDFGQPPILVPLPGGRRALVIGQKSGDVRALDPDRDGAELWKVKVGPGGKLGGAHWGSGVDERRMYVALGGQVILAVADSTVKERWRLETDPTQGGGLFALDLATGQRVWSAPPSPCGARKRCSPAQSAPVTVIPGAVFSGALDGHLRAWSTSTGKVLWDVDTVREYDTVNGVPGRGGSLDVAGPVVVGKMVFVMSGYALFNAIPGNVLLAFSVDGK